MRLIGVFLFSLFVAISHTKTAHAKELPASIPDFVETYCADCHDDVVAKGDRDFIPFLDDPNNPAHLLTLEEILEQLNLGEMPPDKKNVDQPSDEERRAIVSSLTEYLLDHEASQKSSETVLRRLTRYEYKYTIRDLLKIDPEINDATGLFPADQNNHGFVNIGESQVISNHQLKLYLDAAAQYVDQALVFGQTAPEKRHWQLGPTEFAKGSPPAAQVAYRALAEDGSYADIAHGEPDDRRLNVPEAFSRKGIPAAGKYRIQIKAEGVGRLDHGYDPDILGVDTSQPIKVGIWFGEDRAALSKTTTRGRHLAGVFSLKDNQAETYELTTWMPAGAVPAINWVNGSGAAKGPVGRIIRTYHPDADPIRPTEADELRQQGKGMTDEEVAAFNAKQKPIGSVYRGPRLRIYELSIEGPLENQWPPESHRSLVGDTLDASEVDIPAALTAFATRAFRRPVEQVEIAHYISFVYRMISEGETYASAIKSGLAAILTSPEFLYLDEGSLQDSDYLTPNQLANRLSYFLWSSMPDAELIRQASEGQSLLRSNPIKRQAERMLGDPKAAAFPRHFTNAWLRLDKLGSMPPGPKQFPLYLRRRLESAMREETQLFFEHIVKTDRPITDLIDSDYSFLNDNLASHYGMTDIVGEHFRQVSLPAETRRRGLTGHASVLTASANGVDTSPILRGVWVLESLLGTPPAPPPPDVPAIEPDTRGTVTIRDQLAKHREVAACADCHAKIDPWGFALECYDPIGGLRTHYPKDGRHGKGPEIDLSSSLPSGQTIADEAQLRAELLKRKDLVTRNLVRQLITYATGREPGIRDNAEIDTITQAVADNDYRMQDLLYRVITSDMFRRR